MKTINQNIKSIKVGVVGARGYSGQELCRLLSKHSQVCLDIVFFNQGKSFSLWEQFPEIERLARALGKREPKGTDLDSFFKSSQGLDVVFLATPIEVSLELAAKFVAKGISVIDLSGVYRLNKWDAQVCTSMYLKFYGLEHSQPQLLQQSIYGLQPFNQTMLDSKLKTPFLVANPGCYVTSVLMGLIPLLSEGLLDEKSIIVDAKSGASGAGKKMSENLLFSELYSDFYPYKVLSHQHLPEIEMYLKHFSDRNAKVVFTPHLLPIFRGILSTCYLKWATVIKSLSVEQKKSRIQAAYARHFGSYPLAEWGELKSMQKKISLKSVAHSCVTNIAYELDSENLIVFSAIDNLLKGAASQAVENLNCIYGFPIHEGLT